MSRQYSQGVCEDGAAILCDGKMLTVDEIVARLQKQEDRISDIQRVCQQSAFKLHKYLEPRIGPDMADEVNSQLWGFCVRDGG